MQLLSSCKDMNVEGLLFTEMDFEILEDDLAIEFYPKKLKSLLVTDEISGDSGEFLTMGSVDGKEYGLLAGLKIDGEVIDVREFARIVVEQHELNREE